MRIISYPTAVCQCLRITLWPPRDSQSCVLLVCRNSREIESYGESSATTSQRISNWRASCACPSRGGRGGDRSRSPREGRNRHFAVFRQLLLWHHANVTLPFMPLGKLYSHIVFHCRTVREQAKEITAKRPTGCPGSPCGHPTKQKVSQWHVRES